MEETVRARGHENVTARHGSTLEITTDDYLTPAGDCIVGIEADRALADFDPAFVEACRDAGATITLELRADGHTARITGRGDPALTFDSARSMVARTSTHVDDRTLMLEADGAGADLDRDLVGALSTGASLAATVTVGEN